MTYERKIVFGLDEIKGIIFECSRCGSRIAIPPQKFEAAPEQCPNGHTMVTQFPPEMGVAGSALRTFLMGLRKLRDHAAYANAGFKILLELDEPKS